MPSVVACLLAVTTATVPFGAPLEVHLATNPGGIEAGAIVGDLLVVAPPRPAPGGGVLVTVRPLALGTAPVPLPGDPQPGAIDVQPTLASSASPAPPRFPAPPQLLWWPLAAVMIAAIAAALLVRRRSPREPSPLATLQRALAPLAQPIAWDSSHAADVLARECRRFLSLVLAAPYCAMTTEEVTRELGGRVGSAPAAPFCTAFTFADEVRFAGSGLSTETAVSVVRAVMAAAEALAGGGAARR